ncbi:MAG: M20 family metallopeptidase [Anaerolineae bacterium]
MNVDIDYQALYTYLDDHREEMVTALGELVQFESPSTEIRSLNRLAEHLAERWRAVAPGVRAELLTPPGGPHHVLVSFPVSGAATLEARPALLLGHYDTVWPIGTLDERPFTVAEDRVTGPGVLDMKAGLVIAEFALRAVAELDLPVPRSVMLLWNGDEEVGSRTSRPYIEDEAGKSDYVLVLEPAMHGGALKTARKGVGAFTLDVMGLASHAGVAPEQGESAIEELAHQILRLQQMTDLEAGTTVNVGVIQGGSRSNVVAAHARARIDTRAWTLAEASRLEAAIRALKPVNPATTLKIKGGFGRPPMERTPEIAAMFETARRIGLALGLDLSEGASGGGSDGNFTAALGVPTLDGLGAVGEGSHAVHEYVVASSLPRRAALLAGLLCEL